MAQTYTLEEAAEKLALTPEDFKRRLRDEWKDIRSFRDGPTLRFRTNDIDELARSLGGASNPEMPLGPVTKPSDKDDSSEELMLSTGPDSYSDFDLSADDGSDEKEIMLSSESPEVVINNDTSEKQQAEPEEIGPPGDSDVRLEKPTGPTDEDDPEGRVKTEEIEVDLSGPPSASIKPSSSTRLPASNISGPGSGVSQSGSSSGKIPAASDVEGDPDGDSSDFDLDLGDAESDSLDLELPSDSSDEVDLSIPDIGPAPDSKRGIESGINLGKPADSGLSLEKGGPKTGKYGQPSDSSEEDFDLAIDGPDSTPGGPVSGKMKMQDSDSEFDLTLDDDSLDGESSGSGSSPTGLGKGKKDIFETDFDLPADEDSDSEVVSVDEDSSSDFDLDINEDDMLLDDESASEVVALDDDLESVEEVDDLEEVEIGEDLDEGPSASGALRGVSARDDDDEDDDLDDRPGRAVPMAPAQWGALPAVVLLPSMILVFMGGLMSFEMVRGMWGYHQPSKPGNMLVSTIADTLGMKVPD